MYIANEKYGKVRMNSYIPTQKAIKFLNYFQTVGWHDCNSIYHQNYQDGIEGSLLIFTVGGNGILHVNKETYPLSEGTVALVPPETPMEYFTLQGSHWEFYWINLYGISALQSVSNILEEHDTVFTMGNRVNYLEKIKYLISLENENKFQYELEVSMKIFELLHEIIKGLFFNSMENSSFTNLPNKMTTYIEQHYSEPIQLSKLCEKYYVSQNQLIRIFKTEMGYTPHEYLKKHRLMKACELLQMTNHSINSIGTQAGFPNNSNFTFQFKSQYGITPRTYRKHFSPHIPLDHTF